MGRQRRFDRHVAECIGHGAFDHARNRHDVTGNSFVDRNPLETTETQHFGNTALFDLRAIGTQHLEGLIWLDRARGNTTGNDAAQIGVGFQNHAQQAERAFFGHRRGDMLQHHVEHRTEIGLGSVGAFRHPAVFGRTVENREIELFVGRIKRGKQIEHFVHDFGSALFGLVDLVDRDNRLQAELQRLADHEFGLRHRAFGGIDQHDHAVDHVQDTLDLAAEIGMARSVDDVDPGVFPLHRGALRQNGNAALALQIVGVHGAFGHFLVFTKRAGLGEKLIHQRGLAVVNVRDDRDIPQCHFTSSRTTTPDFMGSRVQPSQYCAAHKGF